MSPYTRMYELTKFFACKVYDFHFEIIKWIQANNKQYKFKVDLLEYNDAFNIWDYFIIQIRPKQFPFKTSQKLQANIVKTFKVKFNN
jgi:hypothetical protein